MVTNKDLENSLKYLEAKMLDLTDQVNTLLAKQPTAEAMPTKIDKLKLTMEKIKNRMSLGRANPDDKFRLAALEVELGKWLLTMEGDL